MCNEESSYLRSGARVWGLRCPGTDLTDSDALQALQALQAQGAGPRHSSQRVTFKAKKKKTET